MTALIAYYSRAGENYFSGKYRYITKGNTEVVASKLATMTGATLFKIEQLHPYSDNYQICIAEAKADLKAKARPELVTIPENLDGFDEIFLGCPNYWAHMPMAVYTFLEKFNLTNKRIYPFVTHEGSGLSRIPADIKVLTSADVSQGLAIVGSNADDCDADLKAWFKALGQI